MSSYSITVAWEPDYLKLGNHTLYTAIRTLMFCLQLNVVLCTCYISDSFENTVSHYHGNYYLEPLFTTDSDHSRYGQLTRFTL